MKHSYLIYDHTNYKISVCLVGITTLLSISGFIYQQPAEAASDNINWVKVNIPRQGDIGKWVLGKGSDIRCFTITENNTMYCYADPAGTSERLFKSIDNGKSWSYTGSVTQQIIDIAEVPGKRDYIYYATNSTVYKSINGGVNFVQLPAIPDGTGTGNLYISTIDVISTGVGNCIAAGTLDEDNTEYGKIYIFDENEAVPSWKDTGLANYDVCELAFSPQYLTDGNLVAVVTDETDTFVMTRTGSGNWSQVIGQAVIPGIKPVSSEIVFPDDYIDSGDSFYVALDSGNNSGDVYKIDSVPAPGVSTATDLNIGAGYGLSGVDITGLAGSTCSGTYSLFAGAANCTQVYRSNDKGVSWTRCLKQPTGEGNTIVAADNNGRIYTAADGSESAISCSLDCGATFNQLSMIDTEISSGFLIDFAVSPHYSSDGTIFLLTFDAVNFEYSLWRSTTSGTDWERILNSTLDDIDSIDGVLVSPLYDNANRIIYIQGTAGGSPAIWKSIDNGQVFSKRLAPLPVDTWIITGNDTLIIGCYDSTDAIIYMTEDGGQTFSAGVVAGKRPLESIDVSPNFQTDGIILTGNQGGEIYFSENRGISFRPLPLDAVSPPFNGCITVAFDSAFASNRIIYAGSDKADEGLFRFILGQSDEWERIDARLPAGGAICGLDVSNSGVLYAVNPDSVNSVKNEGGVERSLNPSYQLLPTFETVIRGLDDGTKLRGLWIVDNRLWSLDTANTRLMTCLDTMAQPVILRSPAQIVAGMDTKNVVLDWEVMNGATEYEWQVDYNSAFSSVSSDLNDNTASTSVRLPTLEADTSYHWRVRATKPVLSLWSERRSFTTTLGQDATGPALLSPGAGVELMSVEPLFQWSAIAGAEKYELIVSGDISFNNPVIKKTDRYALPSTAWQSNISLDNGKTYYWKVRAVGSDSYSSWSAVSAFLTVPAQQNEKITVSDVAFGVPVLLSPGAGTEGISQKPLFQWDAITGADSYELMVSADTSFEDPVIIREGEYAVPVTAWKSNIDLDYDTAYYWRVRASIDGKYSNWSPVSAFTIEKPIVDTPGIQSQSDQQTGSPVAQSSPTPVQPEIPGFILYTGIGLLAANMILQTATLLVIVVTHSKAK
jgi:hypothetical protein